MVDFLIGYGLPLLVLVSSLWIGFEFRQAYIDCGRFEDIE